MAAATEKRGLRISPSVKSTETPDGVVLLDIRGGMTFPLDQVCTFIWKRLEKQLSSDAIAQEIASIYHIPFQQASVDVAEFVEQLIASHLLVENTKKDFRPLSWRAAWERFWGWIRREQSANRNP